MWVGWKAYWTVIFCGEWDLAAGFFAAALVNVWIVSAVIRWIF